MQCDLEFTNINTAFLVKLVSVLTKGVTENQTLNRFLQTPKNRTTLNSFLRRQSEEQFTGPPREHHRNLSTSQVRELIAVFAAKSVRVVMTNHFYQIGGRLYQQKEGSAIGVDMSVEAASLYMTTWDEQYLRNLEN